MREAYFMVRAVVEAPLQQKFDQWYSSHHLPMALAEFKAKKAWRFWSTVDRNVHYAVYQFANEARLKLAMKDEILKPLIADFDKSWPSGVTRARDLLNLVEERSGGAQVEDEDGATAKAYLMVRAVVEEPLRQKFDRWYSSDHLPKDVVTFRAEKAWRFWSTTDAAVHYAVYRFADQSKLDAAMKGEVLKPLIADFDQAWPSGVTRSRDLLTLAEAKDG